jgi:SAM-dependent methyltransferase
MCNAACIQFGQRHLLGDEVAGRRVLEVGSLDVNGSLRASIEAMALAGYVGVDVAAGPGVDEICRIEDLVGRFGPDSFDVVVSTEVLEHVRDWRGAISNLKRVVKPGGVLLLTTRSKGFPYHGYPHDFWRYEPDDARVIFADFDVQAVERDPISPGIFVKVRKPASFAERPLGDVALYSIVTRRRALDVTGAQIFLKTCRRRMRLVLTRLGLWR